MKWFKELRKGQKVLLLINEFLIIVLSVLMFTGVGRGDLYVLGIFMGFVNIFSIVFARSGFKFGIYFSAENVGNDVEPSELKYMDWYIKWCFYTLVVLALGICAIVFS